MISRKTTEKAMDFATFEDLQLCLQNLYHDGDYKAALELASEHFCDFPDNKALLYYWRMSMAARTGNDRQTFQILEEALSDGIWYGEGFLRKSPSLISLQGKPVFENLIDKNNNLAKKDQQRLFPLFTLRPQGCCQPGSTPCGLLLGLHANLSNVQGSIGFWKSAASAGWLVAAPQSTQPVWKDAYVWDDREVARKDINNHFATLCEGYSIDQERIILAGHSMGGEIALWLALKGDIQTRGFIAIEPTGPFMDEYKSWKPLIDDNPNENLRGYIILGEPDSSIQHDNIHKLEKLLQKGNIACQVDIVQNAGHDFSSPYENSILRGLDYILS